MTSLPRFRLMLTRSFLGALCVLVWAGSSARAQDLFVHRDLDSGIRSDSDQPMALRFMRHIWITSDSVLATVVQKGGHEGHGLAMYKSLDDGASWTLEQALVSNADIISDGVLDDDNNLLLVTSFIGGTPTSDVNFIKLLYQPASRSWTIDPATPVTVLGSKLLRKLSRATLSLDSNGVIWCAFRTQFEFSGISDLTQIKVFYSADGGYTWTDTGHRFGALNRLAEKSGKLITVGSRTALIYQDMQFAGTDTLRFKAWAYRDDSQPLEESWTDAIISEMLHAHDDTLGTHWSVAADAFNNIHLSYQDAGIRYLKFDASVGSWQAPELITTYDGSYNNISVAANNDLYLFCRFTGALKVFCKQYSLTSQNWSRWLAMSAGPHLGYLRMSSPERFDVRLPMLYEAKSLGQFTMLYVLLDTYYVSQCR